MPTVRCEVHQDAADALYLIGDAVGDLVQDLAGNLFNGGGHGVLGVNRTDNGGPAFITAFILEQKFHRLKQQTFLCIHI